MDTLWDKDIIRRVRFNPYRKGMGPTFALTLWDCHRVYHKGPQWNVGYRLTMTMPSKRAVVLFHGEDHGCSPMHAIDSDDCVRGVMNFLTLKPGDTDRDYFNAYTDIQLDYCSSYADTLDCEVMNRFGED